MQQVDRTYNQLLSKYPIFQALPGKLSEHTSYQLYLPDQKVLEEKIKQIVSEE